MNASKGEDATKRAREARAAALEAAERLYGDDALIDGEACAAGGGVSQSHWHEEVRGGRAPKPVICRPRFTRWRLGDVRQYWRSAATNGVADPDAAAKLATRAKKASDEARARRAAATA